MEMSERRPLCFVALFYTLGIGGYYIFSIPIVISIIGILLGCIASILLFRVKPIFPIILVSIFFVGSLLANLEYTKIDPLEKYAVSPYTNASERRAKDYDAFGGQSSETDVSGMSDVSGDEGKNQTIRGVVLKYRATDYGGYRLNVRVDGRNVLVRVSGNYYAYGKNNSVESKHKADDLLGREITFSGAVEIPEKAANPGGFDYRTYLKTEGIRVIVKGPESALTLSEETTSLSFLEKPLAKIYNSLAKIKYGFLRKTEELMSKQNYAVFVGILFGDDTAISDDIYEVFRQNGVAHILSVSGIHVAIVYAFINMLFSNRRTFLSSIVALTFLFTYAVLSEFSPSVVRAFVMIAVHIAAKLAHKRYDFLTGTCIAALIMLILNPLKLLAVGFQLSFLAVLILAFALPFINRFVGYRDAETELILSKQERSMRLKDSTIFRYINFAVKMMIPLLSIQIIMMPVIIWMFNYVSLSSVFLNIPVVAISGIILPLGVIALLISVLLSIIGAAIPVFGVLTEGTEVLVEWLLNIAIIADRLPLSYFNVASPKLQWIFAFYAIFFILTSERFSVMISRKRYYDICSVFVIVLACVLITNFSPVGKQNEAALTFVDVGQGDCLHIRTRDGRNYLIDGGGSLDYAIGKKVLKPYLLKNGVSNLDAVFVTHLHTDHFQGLRELSMVMKIGKLFTYDSQNSEMRKRVNEEIMMGSAFSEKDIEYISAGDKIRIGEDVSIEVLFPPQSDAYEEDENKTSLMFRLEYDGVSVLMTGDIGFEGEEALLRSITGGAVDGGGGNSDASDGYLGNSGGGTEGSADGDSGNSGAGIRSNVNNGDGGVNYGVSCDVLKVGHHGSKYSTSDEFLDAVNPKISVIQVGKNSFGHPTLDVLEKLRLNDIIVYRNDIDGAIMLDIRKGRKVNVTTNGKSGK